MKLSKSQLTYLLMISSVVSGCNPDPKTQLPEINSILEECRKDPEICKVREDLNNSTNQINFGYRRNDSGSILNYFLIYHLLFNDSANRSVYWDRYQNRFNNSKNEVDEKNTNYKSSGVYNPGYVRSIRSSIQKGEMTYSGKTSSFFNPSKSSITGKSISRGGFGSMGRSFSSGS